MLQRLTSLAVLVLCIGQSAADVHLHLDEHEDEVCTLCAISDPGHILDLRGADGESWAWRRVGKVPVFSALLAPRLFEVSRSRAPPVFPS